jgi:hypothetical protein
VLDAASVACPFCGTINPIPEKHREALRLSRNLDEATQAAAREWSRVTEISLPRWCFVCAAAAPFVLMAAGFVHVLVAGLLRPESRSTLPFLIGVGIWLPLIPAQALAAKVGMMNILVSGAARVGMAFAAIQPITPGAPPNCRQCGAPLSIRPDDILVRCMYCGAESIVSLDPRSMRALQSRLGSARSSLAQAMAALATRVRLVRLETWGRTCIIAGLLILPLIWSFVTSLQTTYWSMLIALDVWILGICIFWNAREAFLPPVTLEELDALLQSPKDMPHENAQTEAPATPLAGTRGWYEHAFEAWSFIIPAILALMFLAIELLVLKDSGSV